MLYKLINVAMLPISQKSCYVYISHSLSPFSICVMVLTKIILAEGAELWQLLCDYVLFELHK